jgi:hypothetical protein
MAPKKPAWGKPGETGVSKQGIPWRVPNEQPGVRERLARWLSLAPGDDPDETMPRGAEFVPARTADEVAERCMLRYGGAIADLDVLAPDETLTGFTDFGFDGNVPLPPHPGHEPLDPARDWWMGGRWDSTAGQLLTAIDDARTKDQKGVSVLYRGMLWIRTSRRVLVLSGNMETTAASCGEYPLEAVGLHPGWQPADGSYRVDIAFADGSWLGATGLTTRVPGGKEGHPDRDLLARLAGDPVTETTLPEFKPE